MRAGANMQMCHLSRSRSTCKWMLLCELGLATPRHHGSLEHILAGLFTNALLTSMLKRESLLIFGASSCKMDLRKGMRWHSSVYAMQSAMHPWVDRTGHSREDIQPGHEACKGVLVLGGTYSLSFGLLEERNLPAFTTLP